MHWAGKLSLDTFSRPEGRDGALESLCGQKAAEFVDCTFCSAFDAMQPINQEEHAVFCIDRVSRDRVELIARMGHRR
jgi:hypothetical protein